MYNIVLIYCCLEEKNNNPKDEIIELQKNNRGTSNP